MSYPSFHASQDQYGNYVLTIPKCNIHPAEMNVLLKRIENIVSQYAKRHEHKNWSTDPARFIVGLGCSNVQDGSTSHDKDIYGL